METLYLILIPTIFGFVSTVLVPYMWKWQQNQYQIKTKVIEEHNSIYHIYLKTVHYMFLKLTRKFQIINSKSPQYDNLTWDMRENPLKDIDLLKLHNEVFEISNYEQSILYTSHSQLIMDNDIRKCLECRGDIIQKMRFICYQLCNYSDEIDIEESINKLNISEHNFNENEIIILNLYMKTFTIKYIIKKRFKNLFKKTNPNMP